MAEGEKEKYDSAQKRVENKLGRMLNFILNSRPSVLFYFLMIKEENLLMLSCYCPR